MAMEKRNSKNGLESRLEKTVLRLMPELPKVVGWLERRAKKFDGLEPRTFMRAMESEANYLSRLIRLIQSSYPEVIGTIEVQTPLTSQHWWKAVEASTSEDSDAGEANNQKSAGTA